MKKVITLMTLLVGFAIAVSAQAPPANVQSAFKAKFPNGKTVKWEKENANEWEAEFKQHGVEYSANFSNEGVWKETEHEMKASGLPSAVQSTLNREFPGFKVEEAEKVETPEFIGYEVEIKNGGEVMEVVLNKSGKIIKKWAAGENGSGDGSDDED